MFGDTLFAELCIQHKQQYREYSDCFGITKKCLIKSSHPKKYLPNFPTKKILQSKISNPKKSFDHPRHRNQEYPPHWPCTSLSSFTVLALTIN